MEADLIRSWSSISSMLYFSPKKQESVVRGGDNSVRTEDEKKRDRDSENPGGLDPFRVHHAREEARHCPFSTYFRKLTLEIVAIMTVHDPFLFAGT